jgi:hypothetical protein
MEQFSSKLRFEIEIIRYIGTHQAVPTESFPDVSAVAIARVKPDFS